MIQEISPAMLNSMLLQLTSSVQNGIDGGQLPSLLGMECIAPATSMNATAFIEYPACSQNVFYHIGILPADEIHAKTGKEVKIVISSPDHYDEGRLVREGDLISLLFSIEEINGGINEVKRTCQVFAQQRLGWSEKVATAIFLIR